MSDVVEPAEKIEGRYNLRSSPVDLVASLLMSSVVMVGLIVFLLVLLFLTKQFTWGPERLILEPEQVSGRGDHAEGFERDIEPPGSEEFEELNEPTLEDTLEAVTSTVSTISASLDSMDTNAAVNTAGTGRGDSRPPGPLGDGPDLPRFERWELKFQAKNLDGYASQLDFFKIELGAIGGGLPTVDYAENVSGNASKRSGKSEDEKRLYFMYRQAGPLLQYDRQLLGKASIPTSNRQVLQFVPKALEDELAQLEMRYAISKGHERVREIAKTIFESRPTNSGFEFVVIEQRYRLAPK